MKAPRFTSCRQGRFHHEFTMILVVILVISIAGLRMLGTAPPGDQRPFFDRALASFLGILQCFGLVIGISFILASIEVLKQTVARYQARRVENKLARLEPILRGAQEHLTPSTFTRVLRLMRDGNETVRQQAFSAAFTLLRADPALTRLPQARGILGEALLHHLGFAQTMATTPLSDNLLARVTLGAKLGAGSSDKRLAPVTNCPMQLARWVEENRRTDVNPEIQVSIGYDTGHLPYLVERSRFLALYIYISTTDLKRFQALLRRPPRDPNAAYGLVIRGDIVEVKYPGQARGHRLDYVFPLPVRLSEANLAGLFRELQLLNLGLLAACTHDLCRVLMPCDLPDWLDSRRQALGYIYREFERRLIALLRAHDRYRDPALIHRLNPVDHAERVRALESFRLEECLYPYYSWVVPLYDPDTRWERLLAPLRAVEAMLLHQGAVEHREVTRGLDFLQQVRRLGYETASAIDQVCTDEQVPAGSTGLTLSDPFIDPAREDATLSYLRQVSLAIARHECCHENLPDPVTFRQAAAYYDIEQANESAVVRKGHPEGDS